MQVARTELGSVIRLFRFWLVAILLSSASLIAYALSCLVYFNIAPFNISFVGGTPPYLLGNLDPTYFLFFQAGLLLLTFDHRNRIKQNRLLEVVESQPVTNLQYQLGRTLCYSGLVWAVIVVNVLLMQCIGLVSQLFNFDIADTIQLHSMFNLLVVDAPVALLFWTSLFLLLSNLLRSRLLVLVTSVIVMLAYYLWVLNTPFSFVDLLSHSSNQTLFISDIMPALPSTTSWIMRIGVLLLVVALLTLGAWWYLRTDSANKVWTRLLPLTSLAVAGLVLSTGVLFELIKANEIESWKAAHLTYEWNTKLDIQAIHGEVEINPSKQMRIDLDLYFRLTSESPVQTLVFTLNPGYRVSTIYLNETACEFEFDRGILAVSVPYDVEPEIAYSLKIEAMGKPDPQFAYLNAPYDYRKDANFPIQALHSFGTDGSIYNRQFVALMPGAYWYPVPGPVPSAADDDSLRSDFFDVELRVQLHASSSWKLVGPATSQPNPNDPSQYQIKPNIPIASIGLFASEFVEIAHEFENIKLGLYLHSHHSKNFAALEQHSSNLVAKIEEYLAKFEQDGFPVPYQSLVFVEVPNILRTIGGGWRMNRMNSLPSMILLKERGLPTLNVDRLVHEVEAEDADQQDIFEKIWRTLYYASENALGSENLDSPIRDQIWSHIVFVSGEHKRALDLIFFAIMGRFTPSPSAGLFSIYASAHASRITGVNFPSALGLDRSGGSGGRPGEGLKWGEMRFEARPSIRNYMEQAELPSLNFEPNTHQHDFEVLYLKSKTIHQRLFYYFGFIRGVANVGPWLSSLRREYLGQQFSFRDAMERARDFDLDLDPFLEDWLAKDSLAGFEVSPGTTIRIADSKKGKPRYLFSFEIANTQSTTGYAYTLGASLLPIILKGDTSKRVTIVREVDSTDLFEVSFTVDTGLSLNRGPIGFVLQAENVPIDESLTPVDKLEESDWVPQQNEIIVDDLDAGFVVYQANPIQESLRILPQDWFSFSDTSELFDGTLPDIDWRFSVPSTRWVRRTEKNAFGKFRRTVANSSVPRSLKLHPVRFVAEVPDAGKWSLDFYVHQPSNRRQYGSLASFKFEIENSSNRWEIEFDPNSSEVGWKFVGDFDLAAGKTDVVLVGATKPSAVYADAIRWRKTAPLE